MFVVVQVLVCMMHSGYVFQFPSWVISLRELHKDNIAKAEKQRDKQDFFLLLEFIRTYCSNEYKNKGYH